MRRFRKHSQTPAQRKGFTVQSRCHGDPIPESHSHGRTNTARGFLRVYGKLANLLKSSCDHDANCVAFD